MLRSVFFSGGSLPTLGGMYCDEVEEEYVEDPGQDVLRELESSEAGLGKPLEVGVGASAAATPDSLCPPARARTLRRRHW